MPSMAAGFQVGCAAVGLVVMNPLPAPTATHRLVEEQLTALSALVVMNALAQSGSGAVGLWETSEVARCRRPPRTGWPTGS